VISTAVAGARDRGRGWKATGMHTGLPAVTSHPGVRVARLNAEHTILERDDGVTLPPGERITLIPHYSDSTVLLHRHMYAVRAGRIEEVWPISAAGMLQ
jgi:3-hydroxy-D-aspartate aldolase